MAKDAVNFRFSESKGRPFGMVFCEGSELIKLDEKALQIMLHS